jgi:hypothetical protein
MRLSFEYVALEDAKIFAANEDVVDAWYEYLAMLETFGGTHKEYCDELLLRVNKNWEN